MVYCDCIRWYIFGIIGYCNGVVEYFNWRVGNYYWIGDCCYEVEGYFGGIVEYYDEFMGYCDRIGIIVIGIVSYGVGRVN